MEDIKREQKKMPEEKTDCVERKGKACSSHFINN